MKAFFLFILLLLLKMNVFACTCIGTGTVKNSRKYANLVVLGTIKDSTVFSVPYAGTSIIVDKIKYLFEVEYLYKGKSKKKMIEIITGTGTSDCGYIFELNKRYIVYLYTEDRFYGKGQKVKPFLSTNICTRTREEDAEEIRQLKRRGLFGR